jgi:nanoRNase/pAp phosphatase (c-di-AMP/oligoRNAs hydrolase)
VNASDIALTFGGGGHQSAAGARILGKSSTVQRRVLAAVKQALAESNQSR